MSKFILIPLLVLVLVGIGCKSVVKDEKNNQNNEPVQKELSGWKTYTLQNTNKTKFDISFKYPNNYVVFDPCTTPTCLLARSINIYKQGTEPDFAKFTTDAESGFSSGDLLVQWYSDNLELKDVVEPYQKYLVDGVEKKYGQNFGLEFMGFGPASVNLFSFKTAGYLFVVTDRTFSKYNQQDFLREYWENFLSSVVVTK